ncbi:MAG: cytochrome c maturation protein CcmE [Oligoflexus sp.]
MNQKNLFRWIVGGGVILVAVAAISTLNFGDNIVYFYTPQEAVAQADELSSKTIKVGALVKPGSVDWQPENLSLAFVLTDMKGNEIQVSHQGTPPDMFKENQGVVVEGRLDPNGQAITSRRLMVKHSEEYIKPDDHSSMNKMLLEESMFKNEAQ